MSNFKFVELFAGIGGFRQGLDQLGGECVLASEWDKFAKQSYTILYGDEHLNDDVTKINEKDVPDHDVLVFGMPCQAFSVAGKRLGFEDMRGTLYFEAMRIAREKKPKVLWMENVKGLVGHDSGRTLNVMAQAMCDIGYTIDFEVLNSKYFGVPQNRERIFMIGIRDDLIEQQPWKIEGTNVVAKGKRRISELEGVKTFNFDWPEQTEVTTRLRDILETNVDERYYLSEEKTAKLVAQLDREKYDKEIPVVIDPSQQKREGRARVYVDESPTITARDYKEPRMIGHIDLKGHDAIKRVYDPSAISPTLTTMGGGHREPKIAVQMNRNEIGKQTEISHCLMARDYKGFGNQDMTGIIEEVRPVLTPDRIEKRQNGRRFKEDGEESFTLTAQDRHGVAVGTKEVLYDEEKERNTVEVLRKLREEVGEEEVAEWRFRVLDTLQSSEVLQQKLHVGVIQGQRIDGRSKLVHSPQTSEINKESGNVREVWVDRECGCTPQGRGLEEQFAREFTVIMPELSYERAQTEKELQDLWESTQGSGLLREALYKIQEIWRSELPKTRYRIRKLTPKETFRLQGFPDSEFDKLVEGGISNSQLYKQAGNAVTVNVINALGRRLLPYLGGDQ